MNMLDECNRVKVTKFKKGLLVFPPLVVGQFDLYILSHEVPLRVIISRKGAKLSKN